MLKIGHTTLVKRYQSLSDEVRRLRDLARRRYEMIIDLRRRLAVSEAKRAVDAAQRQQLCNCKHCTEVAKRGAKHAPSK